MFQDMVRLIFVILLIHRDRQTDTYTETDRQTLTHSASANADCSQSNTRRLHHSHAEDNLSHFVRGGGGFTTDQQLYWIGMLWLHI